MPCPDGGYALLLIHVTTSALMLAPGEHRDDAEWAVAIVVMRRAGIFGRAPFVDDVAFARSLLGYDSESSTAEFARRRAVQLRGIVGDPDLQQWLGDAVTEGIVSSDARSTDVVRQWRAALVLGRGGHDHDDHALA